MCEVDCPWWCRGRDAICVSQSSAGEEYSDEDGDADVAGNGARWELAAEVSSANAGAEPGTPPARAQAREPVPTRKAASCRPVQRRIATILFLTFTGIPARIRRPARAPR